MLTRGGALAWLAAEALEARILLHYEPGIILVVDQQIGGRRSVIVEGDEISGSDDHQFDSVSFNGGTAWGYHVDPNA